MTNIGGNNDQSGIVSDKRLTLLSLFEEESLDDILWQVANATDLAVALADYKGDECTDCINYAEFCRFAREREEPLCKVANATNAFGIAQAAVQKKPFIYFCPYGLLMFAIPINVDGEFIGGFVGGQVRCNDAPADTVHLKNVMPYKADFLEDDEVREIYMQADLIPYKKYVSMAFLMESYFRQLAEKRSAGGAGYRVRSLEKKLDDEQKKRRVAEKKRNKYRLSSLRTQLNPYFVMTTLNAISNMAIIENAVMTNDLINRFAGFMNGLFRNNEDIITIQEEAAMMEAYLAIYKSWLNDRLEYSLDLEDAIRSYHIPAMLAFALVEQAVYHTITVPDHRSKIHIRLNSLDDQIVIFVEDNRPAANPADENRRLIMKQIEEMQGSSVRSGLEIIRERIKEYFNEKGTLVMDEEEDTICCLSFPIRFEKEYF